jgi:hypothetical protein
MKLLTKIKLAISTFKNPDSWYVYTVDGKLMVRHVSLFKSIFGVPLLSQKNECGIGRAGRLIVGIERAWLNPSNLIDGTIISRKSLLELSTHIGTRPPANVQGLIETVYQWSSIDCD